MSSNITIVRGNIFNTKAQTIVNTVNCVGVMGKGIALVFKLRYPFMFDIYKYCCPLKVSEQRDIHPQCCCNGIADDFSEGKPLS